MSVPIEPFLAYARMGISTIPCKRFFDEKSQTFSGKAPAVSKWERFSHAIPTEEEIQGWTRLKDVWGMAIVTGPASNICCVDIDTEDPELQQRILKQMPYTPIVVKGKPGRLGKYLFRIAEFKEEISEHFAMTKVKVLEPGRKSSAVDFFFSSAYICIPPSFHSSEASGENQVWYQWEGPPIDDIVLKNLPVLDPVVIERIRMAVEGMTDKVIKDAVPGMVEKEDVAGRWQQVTHLASELIRNRTPFEVAIEALLAFDVQNFPYDQYFLDKSKGNRTASNRVNAYKFYADMLTSINLKKRFEREMEVPALPRLAEQYDTYEWAPLLTLKRRVNAGTFNPDWMPPQVKDVVMRASRTTAVDPSMIFFYMMGTFSSCLGNKMLVQPYHLNRMYLEACNLYVGLVAKSGERKSGITSIARTALLKVETEEQERQNATRKAAEILNENIEIRIEKVRNDIRKEVQDTGPQSPYAAILHKEIAELEAAKVTSRNISLYEQENTPEAYYGIVEENPNGIFIEFNEWGVAYAQLQATEGIRLRNFLLNGWDGVKKFTYKTKHQGQNTIQMLNLSVGFCAQEDIISHIFWRMLNVKRENDGLMQRFMLVLSDGKPRPVVDEALKIPEELINMFRAAYTMTPSEEPVMLTVEAYDFWMDFVRENVTARMSIHNSVIESFYAKHDGLIVRIAANLAVMKNGGHRVQDIGIDELRTAKEICMYLRSNVHAIKDLAEWSVVHEIARMIEIGAIEDLTTIKDLYRHYPKFFEGPDKVHERLQPLIDHNYLRVCRDKKGYYIKINPKLRNA